jgi:hypothetical protein
MVKDGGVPPLEGELLGELGEELLPQAKWTTRSEGRRRNRKSLGIYFTGVLGN